MIQFHSCQGHFPLVQVAPRNWFSSITAAAALSLRDSEQHKHHAKGWLVPKMLVLKNQNPGREAKNSYSFLLHYLREVRTTWMLQLESRSLIL